MYKIKILSPLFFLLVLRGLTLLTSNSNPTENIEMPLPETQINSNLTDLNLFDVTYRRQIVGEYNKENDIEVHVQRWEKLTNMRASGSDKAVKITPALKFTLEEALEYIKDDELAEVTPKSIRMRKLYLDPTERKKYNLAKV